MKLETMREMGKLFESLRYYAERRMLHMFHGEDGERVISFFQNAMDCGMRDGEGTDVDYDVHVAIRRHRSTSRVEVAGANSDVEAAYRKLCAATLAEAACAIVRAWFGMDKVDASAEVAEGATESAAQ